MRNVGKRERYTTYTLQKHRICMKLQTNDYLHNTSNNPLISLCKITGKCKKNPL